MSWWTQWRGKVIPAVGAAVATYFGGPQAGAAVYGMGQNLMGGANPSPAVNSGQSGYQWNQYGPGFIGPQQEVGNLPSTIISGKQQGGNTFDWGSLGQFAGPASSLIGGLVNYKGALDTNAANAAQAQAQMQFQANQTGTSYQRGVADMKAAGLNPMLAYSQGGAGSGSGAQATMINPRQAGISSALEGARTIADISQTKANTDYTNAKTSETVAHTANLEAENPNIGTTGRSLEAGIGKIEADTKLALQDLLQRQKTNPDAANRIKFDAIAAQAEAHLKQALQPAADATSTVARWVNDVLQKFRTDVPWLSGKIFDHAHPKP
ncbi:MAG: DNA pilot protein [Microvirus sp.]|nr:MAG: DNA pilot protein [Microvirus sp.]